MGTPSTDSLTAEFARIVAGEHPCPHDVLGLHEIEGRRLVRAFRPSATAVHLEDGDGHATEMVLVHDGGIYAAQLETEGSAYTLRAEYEDGASDASDDPYRFGPTVGDLDLHLIGEGRHHRLWEVLGAHPRTHEGAEGTSFAVWAPTARVVRLVGDFNLWEGRTHPLRCLGSSGIWELFVPGVAPEARYKYELVTADGGVIQRADPMAYAAEEPPATASKVTASAHSWADASWLAERDTTDWLHRPVSIYEVHLGSWKHAPDDGDRPLTYRELAEDLPEYVADMGFTHVELMPVTEHPFSGSWGYQVTSYFAPTARFGGPDDLRHLIDELHRRGIGVILDWVPAHFPRDEWALARFDGSALYEHEDPRIGTHDEWGTLVFNFGRHEVRNFLIASALYWLEEYHLDGLRVDGVASMLYLDYSREDGEWLPNQYGGRENLDAVSFIRELNETVHGAHPGVMMVAEESTAWPAVSRPTYVGGLGFGFKWNMGWMHDTLEYFAVDPVHRRYHHHELTFGMVYASTENFVLPLSHDEVTHGKRSLLDKMPGDRWQKAANLRALLAWMWSHPGKQLLFMGGEIGQSAEWSYDTSVDWHLLEHPEHAGVQALVRDLNRLYREEPALWELDYDPDGFSWIDADDAESNVVSFLRSSADGERMVAGIANLSPVPRLEYQVGLPSEGPWRVMVNTDADTYGGSGTGPADTVAAVALPWQGFEFSAAVDLPPLAVIWLAPPTT